jgi:peptide/nickel transport system substrate-binding protein
LSRKRRARLVAVAVVSVAALAAPALAATTHAADSPKRGGSVTFGRASDIISLDPTVVGDNESIWLQEQIFQPIYTISPDGRRAIPWLATGYKRSKNNTVFTFHLRSNLRFSNGKPVSAKDAAFSINRARLSGKGITYLDNAIKSVTAPNKTTVVVKTKYPWAPLVADISMYVNGVIPANFGGVSEKQFWQHPVGTGPFMLKQWKHGQFVKLVRNPFYWQKGKPYLDSVTFTNVPDDNQRILQLKGGQVQLIEFPPFSALTVLAHTPGIVAKTFDSTRVDYLLLNEKVKPFQDVHVRRAISYAIDRNSLVKGVLFGHGKPATSYLGPTEEYFKPQNGLLKLDLQKAKSEMAKSSVPKGFSTTYLATPGDKIAQIAQQQLAPLGIKVTIKNVDPNQFFPTQQKGGYEISDDYWTEDIPDPDERTGWFVGQVASNDYFTHYTNGHLKSLVSRSEKTFDTQKRGKLFAQIQQIQATDLPQVPLYYSPYQYAFSDKVQGFYVSPLGNFHLENVWLK